MFANFPGVMMSKVDNRFLDIDRLASRKTIKQPVPYVTIPGLKQACPMVAASWYPAIPAIFQP